MLDAGAKGRLVAMVPETAAFRTDPISEGLVMGWFRQQIAESGWRPLLLELRKPYSM